MKISVVTAVFNREATIAEAVESVRLQNHTDVEHIVQDGGSRDGTLAILNGLASLQMLVESTHDGGIYEGINHGILRATGEVIGLMHSDDLFASENTLSLVSEAMLDPLVDGVYGDCYVAANDFQRVVRYWRSGFYEPAKLKWGWMPPHPMLYLRRNVFGRLGLYDTDFRIAADYEGMLRFLVTGNVRLALSAKSWCGCDLGVRVIDRWARSCKKVERTTAPYDVTELVALVRSYARTSRNSVSLS